VDAFDKVFGGRVGFQRIVRGDQPPNLIEAECLQGDQADSSVALMRRVEGASEKADPHSWQPEWQAERVAGQGIRH
jgi:hypothetical protein